MSANPIRSWTSQVLKDHHEFGDELLEKTFGRIFYLAAIAAPVSAAHILVFAGLSFEDSTEQSWQTGIILYHSVLCLLATVLAVVTRPAHQNTLSPATRRRLCQISHVAVLAAGAAVTSIDQLVTPAVTPFLVACTVAGVLFIVNPLNAFGLYLLMFFIYCAGLLLTQTDSAILTSNMVNGLTACSIAAGLSWLLWKQNISALQQRNIILEQQQKLELSNRQLEQLATRDELTGLANRRMLQMLAADEQNVMKRQRSPACLLLLDLDHFKNVNDAYGHPAGDQILRQLATLLTHSVRSADRIARWGGEEFGILLRNTDATQAAQVAEHIRTIIQQHAFELTDQAGNAVVINMTVSIGLTSMDAADTDMLSEAYRRADIALYAAKAGGRNRVNTH